LTDRNTADKAAKAVGLSPKQFRKQFHLIDVALLFDSIFLSVEVSDVFPV